MAVRFTPVLLYQLLPILNSWSIHTSNTVVLVQRLIRRFVFTLIWKCLHFLCSYLVISRNRWKKGQVDHWNIFHKNKNSQVVPTAILNFFTQLSDESFPWAKGIFCSSWFQWKIWKVLVDRALSRNRNTKSSIVKM